MDFRRYSVLYVDDELTALKYFPRMFGDTFRCLTAESVERARVVVASEGDALGVVISDQRMPGGTGVELLSVLRQSHPMAVRILTTAHSDLDSAIEAVNAGSIYRYVVKPWEERDLRGVLKRAMELHLLTRERDALLREKLAALQRVVVMDRIRSFAVLAAGLANRLRNPMAALKTFLEQAPSRPVADADDSHLQWGDLWKLAHEESQRVLDLVTGVVKRTTEPDYRFAGSLAVADLVAPALARARAVLGQRAASSCEPPELAISGDRVMLTRAFDILVERMLALDLAGGRLSVSANGGVTVAGAPGVRVLVRSGMADWEQPKLAQLFAALVPRAAGEGDIDLLAAYFAAYHHGGNLFIHRQAPHGPGFEVILPVDPAAAAELPLERDWIESIFTLPEA